MNELKLAYGTRGIDPAARSKVCGFNGLSPGAGDIWHCISIDPFDNVESAKMTALLRFIGLAGQLNTSIPKYVVHRVADALNEKDKKPEQ